MQSIQAERASRAGQGGRRNTFPQRSKETSQGPSLREGLRRHTFYGYDQLHSLQFERSLNRLDANVGREPRTYAIERWLSDVDVEKVRLTNGNGASAVISGNNATGANSGSKAADSTGSQCQQHAVHTAIAYSRPVEEQTMAFIGSWTGDLTKGV